MGCKLLPSLPRSEMGDFGPVFNKMYFTGMIELPKILVNIFSVLPRLETAYFAQPPETSLPLSENWRLYFISQPRSQMKYSAASASASFPPDMDPN